MHKILIFMLVGISVLTIKVGHSQELSQATILTLPIKPEDIGYYCIFDNKVYSPGAQICLEVVRSEAPAQAALVCKPPAAVGGRATWEGSGTIICSNRPNR